MKSKWYLKYKFAQRGLHNNKYPENSLGAFQYAKQKSFGIELDVRLTKDNEVVVFHDDNLQRMCRVNKDVRELTLEELRECRLKETGFTIPTLEEVLDLIHDEVPIIIELKPLKKAPYFPELVYNIIASYKGRVAVKSFNPLYIIWFKKNAPKIIRGMLSCNFTTVYLPFFHRILLRRLALIKRVDPSFISFDINDLPNKYVSKHKLPVIAWTIRSAKTEDETKTSNLAKNIIFEGYIPKNPYNF